jgi:uncharacterized protein with HEPN domain
MSLSDMRVYAIRVSGYVENATFDDFAPDSLLRNGVERCLEIIGEAARAVSEPFRDDHPEIPGIRLSAFAISLRMDIRKLTVRCCGRLRAAI